MTNSKLPLVTNRKKREYTLSMERVKKSQLFKALKGSFQNVNVVDERFYLINDDDQIFLREVVRKANGTAKTIKTYPDQKEFEQEYRDHPNAVLIFDLMQPRRGGIEFAKHLGVQYSKNQVIFISGSVPTVAIMSDIKDMGAEFMLKDDLLTAKLATKNIS